MNKVYIGTSGWSYKGWEKAFYPHDLPKKQQFQFYATQFPTVEINLTFYRLPTPNMIHGWREKAPPGFVYAIKGSRYITHMKKLQNLYQAVDRFFERIEPLKKQIGVILWQLPPFLQKGIALLDDFLQKLPKSYAYAVEFRHPSWIDEEIHILKQSRHRKTVFAYFNNDVNIRAPKNAKMLMDMVGSGAVQALAEAA